MLSRNVRTQSEIRSLTQSTRAQIRAQRYRQHHSSPRAIAGEADSHNNSIKRAFWWLMGAVITTALLIAMSTNTASAQARSTNGEGPGHAFTINPFFVLAGWISGEYEQRVNESFTLGGGASYVDFSDRRYTSFDVKARLYPVGHAMRGFEMGLGIGVANIDTDTDRNDCDGKPCTDEKTKITTPAVSIEFGHQWTLGENKRTMLVVGGGGKRFLASKADLDNTTRVIPFFRVGIGYAW